MIALWLIAGLALGLGPWILSSVALARANTAQRNTEQFNAMLMALMQQRTDPQSASTAASEGGDRWTPST